MFDIDNDGVINKHEMSDVVSSIYNMLNINIPIEEVSTSIFSKIDTKKDGAITEEEFAHGCLHDSQLYDLIAPNGIKNRIY